MNAKYLPVKFAIVALLIVVCIWTLATKGLRPGIDIAGGHSLRFALNVDTRMGGKPNVAAINVLKERLDPDGLRNLEFIPVGNTEIEIRMPAAPADTRQRKRAYTEAMNELMRANIDSGEIVRLSQARGADRDELAANLAAIDPDVQAALRKASQTTAIDALLAYDAAGRTVEARQTQLAQAEADLERAEAAVQADPDLPEAQQALAEQQDDLTEAETALQQAQAQLAEARKHAIQAVNGLVEEQTVPDEMLQRLVASAVVMNDLLAAARAMDKIRTLQDELQAAVDQAKQANRKLQADPDSEELIQAREEAEKAEKQAEDRLTKAKVTLKNAQDKVRRANIPQDDIESVLNQFVSRQQAKSLKDREGGQAEIDRRMKKYYEGLEELTQRHPTRAEMVRQVAARFEAWADLRQQLDDPADLVRLVKSTGVLEFRIAPRIPEVVPQGQRLISRGQIDTYTRQFEDQGPDAGDETDDFLWFPIRGDAEKFSNLITTQDNLGNSFVLLSNQTGQVMLRQAGQDESWELENAAVGADSMGAPAVDFTFDERGARMFAQLTSQNIGRSMAILLDDRAYSAPNIRTTIQQRGQITGDFSRQEVAELVRTLDAGTLPAKLFGPTSETSFDSALGEANKNRGIIAAIAGLIAVAVFMLLHYLLAGFIADLALVLNILLVLGAMSLMDARFTLPGIAGVILTIGIAVDANVLIFERLREEQAKGQSIRMALKNAYQRAFSAIFDANLTTLVTCVILGWVGTEEVRGFAITLGLGVVFSMFTALVVTRWIFQALLDGNLLKTKVPMLQIVRPPRINWMGKRKIFWGISAVMVALGISAMVSQGSDIFGIEFVGGTKTVVQFKKDALVDDQLPDTPLVRQKIEASAGQAGAQRLAATLTVEAQANPEAAEKYLQEADADGNDAITRQEWTAAGLSPDYWTRLLGQIDADGNKQLSRAELQNKPSRLFQISTTETDGQQIRSILGEAFGPALVTRTPLKYEILTDRISETLGIRLDADGATELNEEVLGGVLSTYANTFRQFEGGLAITVRLTDENQAVTPDEIAERISLARQGYQRTEVVGLVAAGGQAQRTRYSEFSVLVAPARDLSGKDLDRFAESQLAVVERAMSRTEASQTQNVGARLAGERAGYAIFAVILSWLAIILYLWFRFGSAQWGLAAVICLIHDVVIVVGLIALSGWLYDTFLGTALMLDSFKINLPMVAAILTVIGYSVNDTIVVFDRIRENRGKLAAVSGRVINDSVNQTLPRTLWTSFTTFLVVFIMYVWGGPAIHAYNFALLAGVVFGTYSSIAIASPLIMGFKKALVAKVTAPEPAQ
jgi:SecD/SecF fusion protein